MFTVVSSGRSHGNGELNARKGVTNKYRNHAHTNHLDSTSTRSSSPTPRRRRRRKKIVHRLIHPWNGACRTSRAASVTPLLNITYLQSISERCSAQKNKDVRSLNLGSSRHGVVSWYRRDLLNRRPCLAIDVHPTMSQVYGYRDFPARRCPTFTVPNPLADRSCCQVISSLDQRLIQVHR